MQLSDIVSQVIARCDDNQAALWIEEQWLEIGALYQSAPIGFAYFDAKTLSLLRLNRCQAEMFGRPAAEVRGKTLAEIMPLVPGIPELFAKTASGQKVENHLLTGEFGPNREEPLMWLVNLTPVFEPDGEVKAIWAVSLGIAGQKRAEAALVESEKLAGLGRMVSSIVHEINNPLEHVANLLYLIHQHENQPEVQRMVEVAEQELKRVVNIAAQTLRFKE